MTSDLTTKAAEIRAGLGDRILLIAETSFLDQAATDDLREAAALIAQQAATSVDMEELVKFWIADSKAAHEARSTTEAALTAAEAERDRLREALKAAKGWLEGWASAERELAVIDAALSTAKERGE